MLKLLSNVFVNTTGIDYKQRHVNYVRLLLISLEAYGVDKGYFDEHLTQQLLSFRWPVKTMLFLEGIW